MNESRIINKLNEFEKRTYTIGNNILLKIANNNFPDTRASTFYMLAQVLRSFKIYFILKEKYLKDRQWYIDIYLNEYKQEWPVTGGKIAMISNNHEILNRDLDQVMLIGYTQTLFSIIESRFRIFTKAIDPMACNNGTADFNKIRDWLLHHLDKKQYENITKFFQLMRNTIHNNGIYMNTKYPRKLITYKGKTYTFEHKKPVEYGNAYQLIFSQITPDLISMLEDIVNSKDILKILSILDPIAK